MQSLLEGIICNKAVNVRIIIFVQNSIMPNKIDDISLISFPFISTLGAITTHILLPMIEILTYIGMENIHHKENFKRTFKMIQVII
jgi:formate/nitrite transporter FocA (FNT family)